jgi:beta-galactosidase/beta-glucuronidase
MELDLVRVIRAVPSKPKPAGLARVLTPWGQALDPGHVLEEHPHPQFARERFQTLNGYWRYAVLASSDASQRWRSARRPEGWDGRILVPFSPEAPLSGVGRTVRPDELLFYERTFEVPALRQGERLLLHFEAVDYACSVWVNNVKVGEHVGAYLPFCCDVTDALAPGAAVATLRVCVWDPSEHGTQLRGKQRMERGNVWYTSQSGIWQPVWMEVVPAAHLRRFRVEADADSGMIRIRARVSEAGAVGRLEVRCEEETLCAGPVQPAADGELLFAVRVPCPHLWSPDDPFLYSLRVTYGSDAVESYCGFRTVRIEAGPDGLPRFCLNHRPLFLRGLLDQGYWPDGLMTAPSDQALEHDVLEARRTGFNLLRKHIKVERDRWYWMCDRLGMLVWQDVPTGGGAYDMVRVNRIPNLVRHSWDAYDDRTPEHQRHMGSDDEAYQQEWRATCVEQIAYLGNHPCIVTWNLFNEGWGQFDARAAVGLARAADRSRPVSATSGWFDQATGDYHTVHNYFRPPAVYPEYPAAERAGLQRAFFMSEFGGLTWHVDGHSSLPEAYGYDAYEDGASWRAAVRELLSKADELEGQGCSGYVFTQLSDVEEETNGLLTYDRRVNKLLDGVGGANA